MSKPLIILGSGGNVHDILDIVETINSASRTWELVGILDDARPTGSSALGLEILGSLRSADRYHGHAFVNAIGSDRTFRRLPEILASTGLTPDRFATLIHPSSSVSRRARLGWGVTVAHAVTVGGGVTIRNHVILAPACIIGHDTTVETYSIIAPGAIISGSVHIAECCYVGAGALVRQHVRVGRGALIGLGAAVIRDVDEGTVVVGNPARTLLRPLSPCDVDHAQPIRDLIMTSIPVSEGTS